MLLLASYFKAIPVLLVQIGSLQPILICLSERAPTVSDGSEHLPRNQ